MSFYTVRVVVDVWPCFTCCAGVARWYRDCTERCVGLRFVCFSSSLFAVLSLQFSSDSVAQHKLYVKEHKVRAERSSHRPLDRTLFVLNIPPYCSQVCGYYSMTGWLSGLDDLLIVSFLPCCLCCRVLSKSCSRSLAVFSPWSWETTRAPFRTLDPSCPSSLKQLKSRWAAVHFCCNTMSIHYHVQHISEHYLTSSRVSKWATLCSKTPPV